MIDTGQHSKHFPSLVW